MKKALVFATAASALFAVSVATAQTDDIADSPYILMNEAEGAWWVYSADNPEGTELLVSANGGEPDPCPEGSYYRNAGNFIVACGTTDEFGTAEFEVGAVMETGEPFPEGAMRLQPNGRPLEDVGDQNTSPDTQSQ